MANALVSIVGAGPGDPDLLTVRAVDRLKRADLVLYDGLVSDAIVALAGTAERVSVARRVGQKALTQDDVSELLIAAARLGQRVVRLKAGDPFVFGRGGEEVRALVDAGVPFEIVPGLSAAIAAPELAGIPVTHRGVASGFLVVSGHDSRVYEPLLAALPPGVVTLVVLMGMRTRRQIASFLVESGWRAETPAALVTNASLPDQRVWTGALASLGSEAAGTADDPGVIVIGDVVTAALLPHEIEMFLAEAGENTWQSMTIQQQ